MIFLQKVKSLLVGDTVIMLGGGETMRMSENNTNNMKKNTPLLFEQVSIQYHKGYFNNGCMNFYTRLLSIYYRMK